MLQRVGRVLVSSAVVGGTASSVWYVNQDSTTQLLARNRLLGMSRAFHTAVVWTRLVAKYKFLALQRPTDDADEATREAYKSRKHAAHLSGSQLVLALCERNGGIFVKLGQHAASLRPAIPDEYIDTLTSLQDRALGRAVEEVVSVLREELDREKVVELVEGIDPNPLGSASLAQVHHVTLRNGKQMALKVQHLGLNNILESDLLLVKALDWAATRLFPAEDYSLAWAVTEFEQNLKQELDFSREAANGMRMRQLIQSHPWLKSRVVIPEVDFSRSSRRVLCYEFADGVRVRDCPESLKPAMAHTVVQLFAAMIFTFGFVHCDPHFGNFLVRRTDGKLVVLDHGLYRQLDDGFQSAHAQLWRAMVSGGDPSAVRDASRAMGCEKFAELFPLMLTNRPSLSNAKLGEPIPKQELREARRRSGFEGGMSLAQFSQIAEGVPVDMLFVLRTMHLVKDLHRMLGGSNRDRFLAYAHAASCAPDPVPPPLLSSASFRLFKFSVTFRLHEAWLDALRAMRGWIRGTTQDHADENSRFSLSQMIGEKMSMDAPKKAPLWKRMFKRKEEGEEKKKRPFWKKWFRETEESPSL